MNSLTELNNYVSGLSLEYTDIRNPEVYFDLLNPVNQTQSVDQGFSVEAAVGINIIEVVNPDLAAVYYIVDISNITDATLTWDTLPSGVTATTPSAGVYRLDGIDSAFNWDNLKSPTITTAGDVSGVFTYTSTIGYYSQRDGNETKTWTTTITVNDITFLTTPSEFVYDLESTNDLTGVPQIIDVDASYPGVTWTVVITPSVITSIDTFTTTGTGGTFSVNSTTKVVTISGTRTEVNSRLDGLQLVSNDVSVDFSLSYGLTNSLNGNTDSVVQLLSSQGLLFLANPTVPAIYFIEDAAQFSVSSAPLITDSAYNGLGTYTYTITPSTAAAISNITTTGTSGSQSFNSTTKVLTITGTRSEINDRLPSLEVKTSVDWGQDFTMTYAVETPRLDTASKIQIFNVNSNDIEITNMALNRSYTANNSVLLFSSDTPFISDFDTDPSNVYSISFSNCPIGLFGFNYDVPGSSVSFSGTKAQCNAKFAELRFWPNKDVSSNSTFTYLQSKNSVQQVNQTVNLIGSSGSFATTLITITASQTWTPTYEYLRYGTFDALLVGGGGGGAEGGGGGGGGVLEVFDIPITNQSYSIVIGDGGTPGGHASSTYGTWNLPGGTGGTTSAFGYSAYGGEGGQNIQTGSTVSARGGNNGLHSLGGTQYFGGAADSVYPVVDAGGGGAGSASNGDPIDTSGGGTDYWSGGAGGNGPQSVITGGYYGGGGGGVGSFQGAGGAGAFRGGGGNGGLIVTDTATAGQANTGGGGGGGGRSGFSANYYNGPGGSGVVVIRVR